ncbi:MAG: UDP-4-amino-4,6-dideoxy-N-acetyl-beta-L-altrosamine transaminase [Actinobacteria bacterium]|nr:UDP-4-amino-4,6-dideoxy-N-acetyl-beta-L-altrosamine transaminase [Actinomycetota bacterium]
MIPYGRQDISEADIAAVVAVLRSDFLTQGAVVPAFEAAVARYCGADHAVAVNSATSALHLSCLALGVGPGDWVWISPITFVASANCARYCGAQVDFVDIDANTCNLSVDRLADKLAQAELAGRLPRVVIPVHLSGQPCDMAGIHALSLRYGFKIIEDASHAIGGRYLGEPIGSGRFSHITVFSFHPVKVITTGEGGMAVTNDETISARMRLLRSHGITRDAEAMTHEPDGPWYYQQLELGFNYRLTEFQAALGLSQLTRLDEFVASRHALAARYDEAFAGDPITIPHRVPGTLSGLHLYVIRLQLEHVAASHRGVFEALRADGVAVNLHYIPVHLQPYYQALGFQAGYCPDAEAYYASAISIPMYASLAEADQQRVIAAVRRAVRRSI